MPKTTVKDTRLQGVNPSWLTEAFTRQLAQKADAEGYANSVHSRLAQAESLAGYARAEKRIGADEEAASRVLALRELRDALVAFEGDPAIDAEVVRNASVALHHQLNACHQAVPGTTLAYEVEKLQYRNLPVEVRGEMDPPSPSTDDISAIGVLGPLKDELADLDEAVSVWNQVASTQGMDLVLHLASATSTLDRLERVQTDLEAFASVAAATNQSRRDAGLTWTAP